MLPFLPPGTRAAIVRVILDGSPPEQTDRILDAVTAPRGPGQHTRLGEDLAGARVRRRNAPVRATSCHRTTPHAAVDTRS
jgi:hypothetical protein